MKMSMIRSFALIFTCLIAHTAVAEGGMGGPVYKLSQVGNGTISLLGGRGAMSVAEMFLVGGGGYGTIGQSNISLNNKNEIVSLNYGGLGLGVKFFPSFFIKLSNWNTIGIGRVTLGSGNESAFAFVVEPELNGEISITSFVRFGLGLSYRMVFADKLSVSNTSLFGFGGQAYLEFGAL